MDRFIHLAMVAGTEAVEDSGWMPEAEEDRCATGVMIGSGIGGLQTIYEGVAAGASGQGAAAVAVLHPLGADQSRLRPLSIKYGFKGPNHSRGDRLRHRRARDRRRVAADHVGRRRRDGRRRRRGRGVRARHRRILRLARAVHRVQRPPARGLAAVGQGSRRLRDGRGRRRGGAGGVRARQGGAARRSTPRWPATACPATPTTSPRRPRAMTARSAPCRRR